MRSRIYAIVTKATREDRISKFYDVIICLVTICSLSPLMFKDPPPAILMVDTVTMYALILDYLLRWMTADLDAEQKGKLMPFLMFPLRPLSLLALLGILPSLGIIDQSWKTLRALRIAGLMHYSSQLDLIRRVFRKQSKQLLTVLGIAASYIYVVALVMFNYEPDTFENFFSAISWAVTMVTSIVYRSVQPQTTMVQIISILSSIFGIGIIALPTGIITSGFMEAINERMAGQDQAQVALNALAERPLNRRMVVYYAVVMTACTVLNVVGYQVATALNLPVWLDTVGTMVAAVLLEPSAALLVGFVNNLVMAVSFGNFAILYYSISAMTAIVVGCLLKRHGRILYSLFMPVWLLVSVLAGSMSFLIYALLYRAGVNASLEVALNAWERQIRSLLEAHGFHTVLASLCALMSVKLLDMAVCFLLLALICCAADHCRKRKRAAR